MKSITTIKIKIPKNKLLLNTMKQYSKAVSYITDKGFKAKTFKRYDLHHLHIQSDEVKGTYCATATELMDKSPCL